MTETPVSPSPPGPGGLARVLGAGRLKVALLAAIPMAFMLGVLALSVLISFAGPGPSKTQTNLVLAEGSSLQQIAKSLDQGGVISTATGFVIAAKLTGSDRRLKAGEYEFPAHASMAKVLDMIHKGQRVRRQVTVPEGVTSAMVVDILRANKDLTGPVSEPAEGSILPETYEIKRGETRKQVLARMMTAQDDLLAKLWPARQSGLPYKSVYEAVIMASIVEKETALGKERPHIAAVFTNRLRAGMRLETDPTIIYGLTKGRPLGRGLLRSEVLAKTPYNTYAISGLPPTPIANPGKASLEAVLNPIKSDDLFFVADGSGGHAFAASYAEHRRNVAKWRKVERAAANQAGR